MQAQQLLRPLVIGLTGGVASGKTQVSDLLAATGATVIDTDVIARAAVAPGTAGLLEVISAFGAGLLDAEGSLDRRRMRERVFADPAAKVRLDAILHPRIRSVAIAAVAAARSPYVLLVVPLLIESGHYSWVDRVLVVDIAEAVQLTRVQARDGISLETAERMLAAQASRSERLLAADEVICNHGSRDQLSAQSLVAHRRYCALAAVGNHRGVV